MRTNEQDDYRVARRPKADEGRIIYPLLRCPAKGLRGAVILSHDITGCYTHYWCQRTIPCKKKDCPACDLGYSPRWHGWLFVQNEATGSKLIFEFTAGPAKVIDKYFCEHRTLRGGILAAYMVPVRANGRLVVEITKGKVISDSLPKAIKLLPILMRMWNTTYEPSTNGKSPTADHNQNEIRQQLAEEKKVTQSGDDPG